MGWGGWPLGLRFAGIHVVVPRFFCCSIAVLTRLLSSCFVPMLLPYRPDPPPPPPICMPKLTSPSADPPLSARYPNSTPALTPIPTQPQPGPSAFVPQCFYFCIAKEPPSPPPSPNPNSACDRSKPQSTPTPTPSPQPQTQLRPHYRTLRCHGYGSFVFFCFFFLFLFRFFVFFQESNGKISRNEMQAALAQRGVAHEEIEELFKSLDLVRRLRSVPAVSRKCPLSRPYFPFSFAVSHIAHLPF